MQKGDRAERLVAEIERQQREYRRRLLRLKPGTAEWELMQIRIEGNEIIKRSLTNNTNMNKTMKTQMTFGEAIELLKQGKKVAREGWNGKRMFLYYVSAGKYPVKMEAARSIADESGLVSYGAYIAMKTAQGNVVPWLASQTDMLSEDWVEVK